MLYLKKLRKLLVKKKKKTKKKRFPLDGKKPNTLFYFSLSGKEPFVNVLALRLLER